jgi:hypothetical protein
MIRWLRSLFAPPPPRGTLTLLPEGRLVLGTLPGVTPAEMVHLRAVVIDWLEGRTDGILALPWAVDVIDMRRG